MSGKVCNDGVYKFRSVHPNDRLSSGLLRINLLNQSATCEFLISRYLYYLDTLYMVSLLSFSFTVICIFPFTFLSFFLSISYKIQRTKGVCTRVRTASEVRALRLYLARAYTYILQHYKYINWWIVMKEERKFISNNTIRSIFFWSFSSVSPIPSRTLKSCICTLVLSWIKCRPLTCVASTFILDNENLTSN